MPETRCGSEMLSHRVSGYAGIRRLTLRHVCWWGCVGMADTAGEQRVSASGERSVAIGGDNTGVVTTGDNSPVTQVSLGPLRPVGEVPAASSPVGVPGVGVFVGRGVELERLHAAVSGDGAVVVCAVAGLGGIGKSTLTARYAVDHAAQFTQVVWVAADSVAGVEAGLAGFAVALEPHLAGALVAEGLRERALGWLAAHSGWLLVLDNVTDPGSVRDLLPKLGSGRVVVTSRRASGWAGIAQPLALDVLSPAAARELIAVTVGRERARLLTGVEELCARLGFLPLALEQAAAYMAQNVVSAQDYLGLLESDAGGLFGLGAEGTGAEHTLARVWAVSLDAVADDPLCGLVLRVAGWLSPDGFARSLLAGLGTAAHVVHAVGRLAAYSLLSVDEAGVVTVHRLVQEVTRTAQTGDPHRDPALVEAARETAARLLHAAIPGAVDDPACWPNWRELAAQVRAYSGHAPAHTDSEDTAFLLDRTGCFLHGQGSAAQAIALLQRAANGYERALGVEHLDSLACRNNLAEAYYAAGDYGQAAEIHKRTLDERERVLGPDHPKTLASRNNLANAYYAAGDYELAAEIHERTLAECERTLGPDHLDTLISCNNLANAYYAAGNYGRAAGLYERTLAVRERVLGAEHPSTLHSVNGLATTYHAAGYYGRAAELFERTLAVRERVLGPEHPHTLLSRNNLAAACFTAGQYGRAIELHEDTLAVRERVLGSEHPHTLTSRTNLAEAYFAAGQYGRAIELYERTLADYERVLGPEHPETQICRDTLRQAREAES